jgi:hypothetical protein
MKSAIIEAAEYFDRKAGQVICRHHSVMWGYCTECQDRVDEFKTLAQRLRAEARQPASGADESPPGWVSVEERMPDSPDPVLVFAPANQYQKIAIDCWSMQRESPVAWSSATIETGMYWGDHEFTDVTHWMPLPAPPASEDSQSVEKSSVIRAPQRGGR